ncbi:GPW/gp25 family protein [Polyangium sorediatum]|uniref:GPW/gp25 family protein n=1 Tax=Polyangium sorediatum TaxID=889274 RepID=A0ABT6NPH6_9BACT|nr:GPW/gp25 family protein [Polyangium sorediatum]MDI1430183.1 GPW/gp25 family protein [Polyangium sorediatum]
MKRCDYAFPFRIDGVSGQGARTPSYEAHVEQMIRQVLLTTPGERVNRPLFGAGLRRLLFAPNAEPLNATAQMLVLQALTDALAEHIDVKEVKVHGAGEVDDEGQILIRIDYVIRQTRAPQHTEVLIP